MDNLKKSFLIIALIIGIVAMTVAFAALSTNLSISGTADVASTTWNIHFQNWALDTAGTVTEGGVTHQNTADYPSVNQLSQTVSVANSTKVENLNVTLKQPGDYVKYTFQIINEGSIDASLNNFTHTMTCESGKTCDHLTYTVECKDSQENNVLTQYSTLYKNGGLAYCTLQVKYNEQTNTGNTVYTQEAVSATLSANWQYIQKVDNNSGNSSSGGNEPVVETWDRYFTPYPQEWSSTLPQNETIWVQKNTNTDAQEVCGITKNSDTVCIKYNPNGYSNEIYEGCDEYYDGECEHYSWMTSGYVASKKAELENAGFECSVESYNETLHCYISMTWEEQGLYACDVFRDGSVYITDNSDNNCCIGDSCEDVNPPCY